MIDPRQTVMQQITQSQDANNADAQKHKFAHMECVPATCLRS